MFKTTEYIYISVVGIICVFVKNSKFESNLQVFERCPGNFKMDFVSHLKTLNGLSNVLKCVDECTLTDDCTAVNFCKDGGSTTCDTLQAAIDMTTCETLEEKDGCTFVQMVSV